MALVISDDVCGEGCKTNILQFCERCSSSFCKEHIQTHLKTKKCPECKKVVCIDWFKTKFMLDPGDTSYEFRWCWTCNVRSQLSFLLRNKDSFKPSEQKEILRITDLLRSSAFGEKVVNKLYGESIFSNEIPPKVNGSVHK